MKLASNDDTGEGGFDRCTLGQIKIDAWMVAVK